MKKYLYSYINEVENKLKKNIESNDIQELINKINFFSHERLIHLIITLFFAFLAIIFTIMSITYEMFLLWLVTLIIYILLIFYILHYYKLENGVQYLYKLYDKMIKKIK